MLRHGDLLIDTAAVPPASVSTSGPSPRAAPITRCRSAAEPRASSGPGCGATSSGPLGVFRIVAAGNTMIRTSRAIAAGDPECLHVSVILAGQLNAAQSGRHCVAGSGDMMSYETSRPVVLQADQPFETLVVRVPRRLLGGDAEKIGNLTAREALRERGATEGDGRVPQSRRAQAGARPSGPGGRCADGASASSISPDSLYADGRLGRRPEPVPRGDPPQRRVVHRGQHRRSALDPEDIARATFISTRYLHKLFAAEGTSVCRWIRSSRLEGCRHDLVDPALRRRNDPDDRESLGPDQPSAFLPLVPQHVRLLAEGVQARNKDGGGDACHRESRARMLNAQDAGTPQPTSTRHRHRPRGTRRLGQLRRRARRRRRRSRSRPRPARRPDRPQRRRQDDLHRRDHRLRPLARPGRARRRGHHADCPRTHGHAADSRGPGSRSSSSTT